LIFTLTRLFDLLVGVSRITKSSFFGQSNDESSDEGILYIVENDDDDEENIENNDDDVSIVSSIITDDSCCCDQYVDPIHKKTGEEGLCAAMLAVMNGGGLIFYSIFIVHNRIS